MNLNIEMNFVNLKFEFKILKISLQQKMSLYAN
jgi:hypothetical protein